MKRFGKTIKLFLIDGEPNGRMSCELSNWTGKAFKIPRKQVKQCSDRIELQSTGVYLLLGKSENTESSTQLYIGEAEIIYKRLNEHLSSKDFWNEVICFVSKDENLNKAHIKYIENRLHEIANIVDRSEILNGNIPNKPNISESDQAEMEEFIDNIKLMVNTLGYKIFDELIQQDQSIEDKEEVSVFIEAARGAKAMGQMTNEGFVVTKNSEIADSVTNSFPKSMIKLRDSLIRDGVIVENEGIFKLTKDYLFSSPSAAAAIVMGRSANGLNEWKSKDGRVLKSIESGK
jgi:excinuclease UvrABC nuclease subunit